MIPNTPVVWALKATHTANQVSVSDPQTPAKLLLLLPSSTSALTGASSLVSFSRLCCLGLWVSCRLSPRGLPRNRGGYTSRTPLWQSLSFKTWLTYALLFLSSNHNLMVNTLTNSWEMKHRFPPLGGGGSLPFPGKGCVSNGGTLLGLSFEWVLERRLTCLPGPRSRDGMRLVQSTWSTLGFRAETPVLRWTPTWAHLSRLVSFSLLCRSASPEQHPPQGQEDWITSPSFLHVWSVYFYFSPQWITLKKTTKQKNKPQTIKSALV